MKWATSNVKVVCLLLSLVGCSRARDYIGLTQGSDLTDTTVISGDDNRPKQMTAVIERRDLTEILELVSQRSGHEIWRASSGDTLTLREGLIVGTTALTPDLYSVEAVFPSQWRNMQRPATTNRVHRYVDGDEQEIIRGYQCELSETRFEEFVANGQSRRVGHVTETCYNLDQSFTNTYWLDQSGKLVQSRQWLGPDVGFVRLIP